MSLSSGSSPRLLFLSCVAATLLVAVAAPVAAPADRFLALQAKIPLGDVKGRIDHLALDQQRQLLYVAELGNDTLGVVDLQSQKVVRRISGLSEPQGVAYVPTSDLLFIANGRDGSV